MKVTRTVRYLSVRYGPELLLFVPVPYPVLVEPRVPPSSIEHGGLEPPCHAKYTASYAPLLLGSWLCLVPKGRSSAHRGQGRVASNNNSEHILIFV